MCEFLSAIVTQSLDVLTVEGVNSHAEILKHHKIADVADDDERRAFVKVECVPGATPLDVASWHFKLDEKTAPLWWAEVAETAEKRVRAECAKHIFTEGTHEVRAGRYYVGGDARVSAYGDSTVEAYDRSRVYARGDSTVAAHDKSTVEAYDRSRVYAYENSTVKAYGDSRVDAHDDSVVEAHCGSEVYAYDDSRVDAYDDSVVTAYDDSVVAAHDNSTVYDDDCIITARNDSPVDARDNSKVTRK